MDNFNSSDDQSSTESLPDWASSGQGNTTYDALIRAIDEIEDELDLGEDVRHNVESATQNLVNRVNESGGINERRPDQRTSDLERNIAERLNNSGIILPPPSMPMPVAREISKRWISDGESTLRHWRGSFWEHTGRHWSEMDDHDLKADLYSRLERATCMVTDRQGNPRVSDWNPNRKRVGDLLEALAATQNTRASVQMPSWLDGTGNEHLIACQNVLVNPLTGQTREHTPAYFNSYSLGFDYDASTDCPMWHAFLDSVFPDDDESKALLQEWFGYVLSGRTDFHKMMFMKGLPRSGKGLIARILTKLQHEINVCGPTFDSFCSDFGLELLISSQLAIVGDARYTGDQKIMQNATSKLLTITGGDEITINRKYKKAWTGKLPTRLMLLSNEMPKFKDSSDAIADRMLLLIFKVSFLGREDLTLEDKLTTELSGIFNWALAGYQRLNLTRKFTEPAGSKSVMDDFRETVSPIKTWLNQECQQGGRSDVVASGHLYQQWVTWCAENDCKPGGAVGFLRLVQTVWPDVDKCTNKITDTNNQRVKGWHGIIYRGSSD